MNVSKYAADYSWAVRRPVAVSEMPSHLQFSRLGAVLRKYANENDDDGAALARAAVTSEDDLPLSILRDYLAENPDHPLATKFNWERLPEKVALDRDLAAAIDEYNSNYEEDQRPTRMIHPGMLALPRSYTGHRALASAFSLANTVLASHPDMTIDDAREAGERLDSKWHQQYRARELSQGPILAGVPTPAEVPDYIHREIATDRRGQQLIYRYPDDPERY